jgi:DNA-binding protein
VQCRTVQASGRELAKAVVVLTMIRNDRGYRRNPIG